jgi:hypothetical protein
MSEKRRRIALRPSVTSDDVDNAAWELDWTLLGTYEQTQDSPKKDVYQADDDDDTRVHLMHDDVIQLRYLVIVGPSADKVAKAVAEQLETVTVADAKKDYEASEDPNEKDTALLLAGVAADDGKVPAWIRGALDHDDAHVRDAAVFALGYIEGEQAEELLERVAADDADDEVRDDARLALKGMRGQRP